MNDIEMYRNETHRNKVNREHMRNIGKVFKVKTLTGNLQENI